MSLSTLQLSLLTEAQSSRERLSYSRSRKSAPLSKKVVAPNLRLLASRHWPTGNRASSYKAKRSSSKTRLEQLEHLWWCRTAKRCQARSHPSKSPLNVTALATACFICHHVTKSMLLVSCAKALRRSRRRLGHRMWRIMRWSRTLMTTLAHLKNKSIWWRSDHSRTHLSWWFCQPWLHRAKNSKLLKNATLTLRLEDKTQNCRGLL